MKLSERLRAKFTSLEVVREVEVLEAEIERLKALWQPIETAPEDGAWALVYWDGTINCAFVKRGCVPEDWTQPQCPNVPLEHATHWMPLPEPPARPQHGKTRMNINQALDRLKGGGAELRAIADAIEAEIKRLKEIK